MNTTVLAPIATLVVGLVAAYIAYQQHVVARNRLKLDLFDRRYKIYDATRRFLSVIIQRASFEDKDLFEFYAATSDAAFLFPEEVEVFLRDLSKRALDMRLYERKFRDLSVGAERSRLVDLNSKELVRLMDDLQDIKKVFLPYMDFSRVRDYSILDRLERLAASDKKSERI